MKLPDFPPFDTVNEALKVATSRQGIKRLLATPLYANSLYLILSTTVASLFSFFFWLIVARLYAEAVVGYSSAIISTLDLLAMMSLAGLDISLVRFLPQADKPRELINTCFTLGGVISLIAGGIFLAGIDLWSPALGFIRQNIIFCLTFLAFVPLWTLSAIAHVVFLASRKAVFILFQDTIFSMLRLLLPVVLAAFLYTFGVVASWGIAHAIALAVALFLFLPRVQEGYKPLPALNLSPLKDMWRYSSGNYLVGLLVGATMYLLPLMVVNLLGAEQNAYFYIAWMMARLLFVIPGAVSSSLFAEGAHFKDRFRDNITRSLKSIYLLLVPAVILVAAAGKWLLLIFGQSYSLNALHLLWVLCLSALPFGLTSIYSTILRVTDRLKELIAISGFTALSVLVLSYLLMPLTGIIGIGYAWLGAQTATSIYASARMKRLKI